MRVRLTCSERGIRAAGKSYAWGIDDCRFTSKVHDFISPGKLVGLPVLGMTFLLFSGSSVQLWSHWLPPRNGIFKNRDTHSATTTTGQFRRRKNEFERD